MDLLRLQMVFACDFHRSLKNAPPSAEGRSNWNTPKDVARKRRQRWAHAVGIRWNCFAPTIALWFLLLTSIVFAADLRSVIENRIKEYKAETVGIYYESPDGKVFTYNPDVVMHAASTMKVPVMMEAFRQADAGKLDLHQQVVIKNEFASIVDGSLFSLSKDDDSDQELYSKIGQQMAFLDLMERMINSSSNLATNLIIQIVGPQNVMNLMKETGASDMTVLRGVEDNKAYEAGRNNTTSARALAQCLKAILNPKLFHKESMDQMFRILLSQKFQEIGDAVRRKDSSLQVASKDGFITAIHHDAAIVRDAKGQDTILVILTRGVQDDKAGEKLVGVLAGDIWAYYRP
jgi:beta-lactamase class A